MVGEIRDLEMAKITIKAAQTGHLVCPPCTPTTRRKRLPGLPTLACLVLGVLIFVAVALTQAHRCLVASRRALDIGALKLPIVGQTLHKSSLARFARTLGTMFAVGVSIVEAMDSVAGATGNARYRDAGLRMKDEVAIGTQLQQAMRAAGLFPNMVVQMVGIDEESGSLNDMLGKMPAFYEAEVDNLVDGLSSLLEPFIMAILGAVVGGLMIAMYLPIFILSSVV